MRPRRVMRLSVADQRASICRPVIGNGIGSVLRHHVDIEIDQPFARNGRADGSHAMCRMTDRARETILVHMVLMVRPTRHGQHRG